MFETPNPEPAAAASSPRGDAARDATRRAAPTTARSPRSRTTSCGWARSSRRQIRAAIAALVAHDADAGPPGHHRRPPDQRGPAQGDGDDRRGHRDPEPGRPRPALPADARPRELRAGADGRPRRRPSPSRRASSRRYPPLEDYVDLPLLGERVAELVHGIIRALVDVDEVQAREVAKLDDEVDDLYHKIFDEVLVLMREDPAQRRARDADPVRVALPRADRRPGDEHRRGHRVPRLGRGRGPQPVTEPDATTQDGHHDHGAFHGERVATARSGSSSCAGATARGRSSARRCSATSAASEVDVYSAGIEPKGVNPLTIRVLEEAGISTDGLALEVGERLPRPAVRLRDHRVRRRAGRVPGLPRRRTSRCTGATRIRPRPRAPRRSGWPPSGPSSRAWASGSTSSCRSPSVTRRERTARPARIIGRVIALHLLRHAHAGDPERWHGDDAERPLSEKGRRQAERLGRLLAASTRRPTCSSPRPRCGPARRRSSSPRRSTSRSSSTGGSAAPLDLSTLSRRCSPRTRTRERPCLVGHDPDFSELLGDLLGVAPVPMRKGAIARVDVAGRGDLVAGRGHPALPAAAGGRAGQVARLRAPSPAATRSSASASRGPAACPARRCRRAPLSGVRRPALRLDAHRVRAAPCTRPTTGRSS